LNVIDHYSRRSMGFAEPRKDWPRGSPCAKPQVDIDGTPGDPVNIEIDCHKGRRFLPVIRVARAA
jgi:hypothetical protein